MKILFASFVFIITVYSTTAQWITKGPYGGAVTCLAAKGSNVFAGTFYGGVFLSADGGNTWSVSNNGLYPLNVAALTIADTGVLLGNEYGIFLSTDNGASWAALDSFLPFPGIPCTALAATGSTFFTTFEGLGTWISPDNGLTWIQADSGIPYPAATHSFAINDNNVFAGTDSGVYRYNNNTNEWIPVNNDLPILRVNALGTDGEHLFAGTSARGVFVSDTGETQWQEWNNGLSDTFISALLVTADKIYVGTYDSRIFASPLSGANWAAQNFGVMPANAQVMALVSDSEGFAAAIGSEGMFTSVDGMNWNEANTGISATWVMDVFASGKQVFCNTLNNGVFISTDGVNSWSDADLGLNYYPNSYSAFASTGSVVFTEADGNVYSWAGNSGGWAPAGLNSSVTCLASTGDTLVAATVNAIVYLSTDNGKTWVATGSEIEGETFQYMALANGKIFAVTDNVALYTSADYGATWNSTALNGKEVFALGVSDSLVLAATGEFENLTIYFSTDNGNTWAVDSFRPTSWVTESFLITGSGILDGTGDGVYFTRDVNQPWVLVGLPGYEITSLTINSDSVVYAGTYGGSVWQAPLSQLITGVQPVAPPSVMQISLSPNPATGTVQLQVSNDLLHTNWSLYNLTGQLISNGIIENSITGISTGNLAAGIYMVSVQGGAGIVTQKLVVEK